ncbi:MAG: hypothetical protein M0D55_18875 [Elusimicrobiota bacterium]|nr:MAG: hypothetical protein M0D55_18875 [Elusimicrobiota bacterium]
MLCILLPMGAQGRSLVPFTIDRLITDSDLVVMAKVDALTITISTENPMGDRVVQAKEFVAKCSALKIYKGKSLPSLVVKYRDNDYYGGFSDPYKAGNVYLLFLKSASDGSYSSLQMTQGIAPLEKANTNFYFGPLKSTLAQRYLELYVSTGVKQQEWNDFAKALITENYLEDERKTWTTFHLLASLPNPSQYEDYFLKGLGSQSSRVILDSARRLVGIGSERGIAAIVELYLRKKTEGSWGPPSYLYPYEFNQLFRENVPAGSKLIIQKFRDKYPNESELFKGT